MNIFEGYVGIRLWDGQLVDDVIFSLLLFLFIVFSFVFRTNFQLFVKMLKDAFLVKERQNLFDDVIGKSIFFFRNFGDNTADKLGVRAFSRKTVLF